MEHQEALQARAAVGNPSDLVQNLINQLLADGVVAASIVVGRILLAGDHLLGMEKTAVGAGADFVDNVGFKVTVNGTWDIFALTCTFLVSFMFISRSWSRTSLGEECAEAMVVLGSFALFGEEAIGLLSEYVSLYYSKWHGVTVLT